MVVSTRIVLSLLGVLGAIQAGLSFDLGDRYPASYAYPVFAVVVLLVFAVGWMVGGLVGKGLVRGFKRIERAAQTRSAGELTVAAIGLLVGLLVSALLWFPVHTLPYIGRWVILPLFLVVGYLFAFTAAKKYRGILRLVGVHAVAESGAEAAAIGFATLVDTSAIIDGRIADIVKTGFLKEELVVPGVRAARAAAGGRLGRLAQARPRPPRPRGRAGAALGRRRDHARRRLPRARRRRCEAAQAGQGAGPAHPHHRLQPQPPGPHPGRRGAERQRARKRAQAGCAAG